MSRTNPRSTAVVPATAPRTLETASKSIAERLRALAERPTSLSVRELVDRYMAHYAGRNSAIGPRLAVWQSVLGDFALEAVDDDVIHSRGEDFTNAALVRAKARTLGLEVRPCGSGGWIVAGVSRSREFVG
jgi:hypothetical protein